MKKVVVYVRVSTDEQVQGASLDVQLEACQTYCASQEMEIVRVFREEGESAKTDARPRFQEMIRYCSDKNNRINHVVVHKTDRFARVVEDYYYYTRRLRESGITIRSATENMDGSYVAKLMRGILAQIAEFDNDQRSDRSRSSMKRIAERGGWNFRPPLGFKLARLPDNTPTLVADPDTGPLVRRLFDAIADGRYTTVGIRDYATELGLRSPTGKILHDQTVGKMLRQPAYAGRIIGKLTDDKTVPAAFEPLVPPDLFDKVQLILSGQGHVPSPRRRNNQLFALRGLVRCGRCGRKLTASQSVGRQGNRYPYYLCWNKECRAVNVRKEDMERDFIRLLTEVRIESSPLLQRFQDRILDEWQRRGADVKATQNQMMVRSKDLAKQQNMLLDKMLRGVVDENTFKAKNAELTEQLRLARMQYQQGAGDEWDLETALDLACRMVQNAARLWFEMPLDHRQRLQDALFPDGLTYDPESGLGTAVNRWPAKEISEIAADANKMAPPRGIEPLLPG